MALTLTPVLAQSVALNNPEAIISSGAASPARLSANGIVILSAQFSAAGSARAVWDLSLRGDLSRSAGVRVRFRALNAAVASEMTMHINAGGEWYGAAFSPQTAEQWEEMIIPMADFLPEGGGGAHSRHKSLRLRIAAWRGGTGRFELQLASVEALAANCEVAMVRTAAITGEGSVRRAQMRYCQLFNRALAEGGIYPAVIEEADATSLILEKYRVVIVPYAEQLGSGTVDLLCDYLRGGGRLVVCHGLPPRLSAAMQLPGGRFVRAKQLTGGDFTRVQTAGGAFFRQHSTGIVAVAAPAAPLKVRGWWCDSAGGATRYPAFIQSPRGIWFTHVYMHQDGMAGTAVLAALLEDYVPALRRTAAAEIQRRARFALDNADKSMPHHRAGAAWRALEGQIRRGNYPGALAEYRRLLGELADEAFATARQPVAKNEMRGVWMRSKTGLPGENWFRTMHRLKDCGINAVFPNFFTPYWTLYESAYSAADPVLKSLRDPISACIAAAANARIAVHAWCYTLSLGEAPEALRQKLAREGRLQTRFNGTQAPWLCPSDIRNRELLCNLVTELLQRYPRLQGVQFDMIRFESSNVCYCEQCRTAFRQYLGSAPEGWPECTLDASRQRSAWRAFRCGQINRLLQELSVAARKASPRIVISAAVYSDSDSARQGVGQDWPLWLKRGWVDFIAPMNYRPSAYLFQGDVTRQLSLVGSGNAARLRPGIGLTVCNMDQKELARQIQVVRNAGLEGYILFEFNSGSAGRLSPEP